MPLDDTARAIGTLACAERERLCGAVGADDYVVSSTILSMLLMNDSPQHRVFAQALAGANDYTPDWMTCSYECAGWGYVLRRSLATAAETGPRTLLLQIVDIDVHGYVLARQPPGAARASACTLLVDVGREASPSMTSVLAEVAPASAVVRLGRDIRTFCAARPASRGAAVLSGDVAPCAARVGRQDAAAAGRSRAVRSCVRQRSVAVGAARAS